MDYSNWYKRISRPFRSARAIRLLDLCDRGLVVIIAFAYIVGLAWLALEGDARFVRALVVPAATFASVSLLRAAIDAPRPYAICDIEPLLVKERLGKSFPSRHVSSAVIIACALTWVFGAWGALAFFACCIVAFTRIVGGLHFPLDVAAAIAIALACGIIGFVLIP